MTEPWRTSPTAKMPGTFVSSRNGSRSSAQPFGLSGPCIRSGPVQNESTLVALDCACQPIGPRQGANENEHRTRRDALHLVGVGTQHRNFFQPRLAMHLGNAGMRPQLNVRRLFDLVDQILRHGAGERVSANQNHHAFRVLRKIHRGLPRRIRATHNVDHLALARQGLGGAAAVVDPRALQAVNAGSVQPPPLHSGRDHQRMAGNLVAIGQFDDPVRSLGPHAHRFLRRQDFHSKTPRLHHRTSRQIASAQPGWEIPNSFRSANSFPPVRPALRVLPSPCAGPRTRRKPPRPDPPGLHPQLPDRRN